ncbi:MAG: beta-lactamase family protein [Oscillospiraceae bacterium]|jgi:CubicO group peptidase (beta-lactamase class C family)|nr:beta-lactamase family protein [Oscillospiraceae bacterium]
MKHVRCLRAVAAALALCVLLTACGNSSGQPVSGKPVVPAAMSMTLAQDKYGIWPTREFEIATPESQGIDSEVILDAMQNCVDKDKMIDGLLILRHGKLVHESYRSPYTKDAPHEMYSVTKSVLSALVGIAMQEGYIQSVDQKVIEFFPGIVLPEDAAYKKDMTVRHLLTMTSGIRGDDRWDEFENAEDVGEAIFLLSQKKKPGEAFKYDSIATHLLGCVVAKAVNRNLFDYAKEKLFGPLGMESVSWWADNQGNNFGGFGISMTPRDMLRFGYLYLNNGRWEDKQILSADWVAATPPTTDGRGAYGFLFWNNSKELPENFEANGAYGQHIIIFPKLDMVVAITADGSMNSKQIYRIFNEGVSAAPLPENPDAQAKLAGLTASIGEEAYPPAAEVLAKAVPNSEVTVDFNTLVEQKKKDETLTYSVTEQGLKLNAQGETCGLATKEEYAFPLMVTMRARSESDEISPFIGFQKGYAQIVNYPEESFNFIDVSDFTKKDRLLTYTGKGDVPVGQTFELKWILAEDFEAVFVNGELRAYTTKAPYLAASSSAKSKRGPLLFSTGYDCELLIESIVISSL